MTAARPAFATSVFVNCPFDDDYQPILQSILFCLVDCGLQPRVASENLDSGELRLDKIVTLLKSCRYAIHDLSRVQASEQHEYARLNMPFELGIDYGMALVGGSKLSSKELLVIAQDRYKYQQALSDIAGWDIRSHDGTFDGAIRKVRAWLASKELTSAPSSRILANYVGYQEWDYERLLAQGWNEQDIQERPTSELLESMRAWVSVDRPMTFN